ncbi:MAG: hypothetical protein DMF71_13900 [Acidobacteria bacterium]|nr:MAG: hypothetical protein DMF71_13900 [Acidobacteriota bacterium]
MRKQAKAEFGIKSWEEKTYDEIEGAPKLTRATVIKSYGIQYELCWPRAENLRFDATRQQINDRSAG